VLFNEPKLLKAEGTTQRSVCFVSLLFNEPKLLKLYECGTAGGASTSFSALQRAEIAEIEIFVSGAEAYAASFSALQRAEIAEIVHAFRYSFKSEGFSALQRAEIAEMPIGYGALEITDEFQCSSTSRNC